MSGPLATTVEVTGYDDILAAVRNPALTVQAGGAHSDLFHGGTLIRIDGPGHAARRRVLGRLLRGEAVERLRARVLEPVVTGHLRTLQAQAGAGGAEADLVDLGMTVFTQVAAAVVGIDAAAEPEGARDLLALIPSLGFREATLELLHGMDEAAVLPRAAAGRADFAARFFRPALSARIRLLAEVEAGRLGADELPLDMLMLVAAGADAAWLDSELALRESLVVLTGASRTSTDTVVHAFDELDRWLAANPARRPAAVRPEFLAGAVDEALRLHPVVDAVLRRAAADVVLPGGTAIRAGEVAVLRIGIANRDRGRFGVDADRFDPDRSIEPGTQAFGLAFSSGPHMCLGLPLAVGPEGTLAGVLGGLIAAGVRPDAARPPVAISGAAHHSVHTSYPVRVPATAGQA